MRGGTFPFLAEHLARLGAGLWRLGLEAAPPGLEHRLRQVATEHELVVRVTIDPAGERIETRPVPAQQPMRLLRVAELHTGYVLKSTDRAFLERARAEAEGRGADEALLATRDGFLAEGTFTSLFFWSDELLCTPDLGLGILPGIGRGRVRALARAAGFAVAEGRFVKEALEGAAIFLANAVRGVIPVASLDGRPAAEDPRTAVLQDAFWG